MATVFKRGGNKAKGHWYASWTDHNGKRSTKCTFTTDKATAERIARKHEADAALRRDGVIDPTLDAISKESQRSIESHLTDFENKLRTANRTDQHVARTIGFVRIISESAGFYSAADIAADAVNRYAGKLRDNGRSSRTIQTHLTAMKGFTKWLSENDKLPRDPLASVKKPNPKADRRRERRILLPEEWRLLETATEAGPETVRDDGRRTGYCCTARRSKPGCDRTNCEALPEAGRTSIPNRPTSPAKPDRRKTGKTLGSTFNPSWRRV